MSAGLGLRDGFDLSGLTPRTLWLHYASVGGEAGPLELEAYMLGLLELDPHEYTVIAQALNDHFIGRGEDHPVAYSTSDARSDR